MCCKVSRLVGITLATLRTERLLNPAILSEGPDSKSSGAGRANPAPLPPKNPDGLLSERTIRVPLLGVVPKRMSLGLKQPCFLMFSIVLRRFKFTFMGIYGFWEISDILLGTTHSLVRRNLRQGVFSPAKACELSLQVHW